MKRKSTVLPVVIIVLLCAVFAITYLLASRKAAVKVIIVPKFEIGEMTGDFPGEGRGRSDTGCQKGDGS